MMKFFSRFVKNEDGATAIEYGLIAALIAVAIVAGASQIGGELGSKFTSIGKTLNTAETCAAGKKLSVAEDGTATCVDA